MKIKLKPVNKKIIIIFLLLAFLPFEHGCLQVSFGFPTVAIDSWYFFEFSKWIPLSFVINIVFALSAILVTNHFYKKEYFKNPYFRYAVFGLIFYNLIYLVYFILYFNAYHLIKQIHDTVIIYIIYPDMFIFQSSLFKFTLKPIFPEENDFLFRMFYIFSNVFYALLGLLVALVKEKIIKKNK